MENKFQELVEIMRKLRAPGGCPWDREQTIDTLKPYLIEEAYEVLEAMDEHPEKLKDELGDLLLQVIFQSQIMSEENQFTVEDVIKSISDKMIRRHPHVFGNINAEDSDAVIKNWNEIKAKEKGHENRKSVLDGVPKYLPPLAKSVKLQGKASRVGFDFENVDDAILKMEEELEEMRTAYKSGDIENLKEEMGDAVFSIVNIARMMKIDIVDSLNKTNRKFEKRFRYVEENCNLKNSTLEEMDNLWNEAKEVLK